MIRKILFVDDDEILRAAIEQRLNSYRDLFVMVSAVDGFDAVKKLKEHPVSLVIVDLVMPRMDGMSLIEHLKQYYPDLPVIVISGIGEWEVSEVARKNSALGYLNKPFQADDLLNMIQLALAREAEGGIMNDISPPGFMQLIEMEARTCTIRVLDNVSGHGGVLFFNQGELFDARIGEVRGLEAAYEIFGWDRTTVFIRNDCRLNDNMIKTSLGSIIMKAAGMKDEHEARPEDYSEEESIAFLSGPGQEERQPRSDQTQAAAISGAEDFSLEEASQKLREFGTVDEDGSWEKVIDQFRHIGRSGGFGRFLVAVVDEGLDSAKAVIPSAPPAVVRKCNAPAEVIREALLKQ